MVLDENQSKRIKIDEQKLSEDQKKLVQNALWRAGVENSDELASDPHKSKLFADEVVCLIAEIIFRSNDFKSYRFSHLVTREGLLMGEKVVIRTRSLPSVSELKICDKPTNCDITDTGGENNDDIFDIKWFKAVDFDNMGCLASKFNNEATLNQFINEIRRGIQDTLIVHFDELAEKMIADKKNYTADMTITITTDASGNVSADEVTRAINLAYKRLRRTNNFNMKKWKTYAPAERIFILLNDNSMTLWEKFIACCYNAPTLYGELTKRILYGQMLDATDKPQEDILAVVYDSDAFAIFDGATRTVTKPFCNANPFINATTTAKQAALGPISTRSRIMIVSKKPATNGGGGNSGK